MERLYTPWRRNYIVGAEAKINDEKEDKSCVFCDIFTDTPDNDSANLLLLRNVNSCILLNKFPYNSGHLMVIPLLHEGDLTMLSAEIQSELMYVTSYAVSILQQTYRPKAFNIGINMGKTAGGSISEHIHIHIVPRWDGDTNFMPVIGQTKTLPEELPQTYERLAAMIKNRPLLA